MSHYHRVKKRYQQYPSHYNKRLLNEASKSYKRILYRYVQQYKHKRSIYYLRSLQTNNPKMYWNFLNKLNQKHSNNKMPSMRDFYHYFKDASTSSLFSYANPMQQNNF
jgi:hypothetical protein